MSNIYAWDVVAANNANADASIDWAEGMSPANVNDSARVMMGRVKELLIDLGGSLIATGTANVIAVTTRSAFTTLANGRMLSFRAFATNTQAMTLNVNAIGAKPILKATGSGIVALAGREIQSGAMYSLQYSTALNAGNGAWLLLNPTSQSIPAGTVTSFAGADAPDGWIFCYGQAVSRATYADLFAAVGTVHGSGDGSTTFNLPDMRGRVAAGRDNMGGTSASRLTSAQHGVNGNSLGSAGGFEVHTLTTEQTPTHSHTFSGTTSSNGSHDHDTGTRESGYGSTTVNRAQSNTTGSAPNRTSTAPDHNHTYSGTTSSIGSGNFHNNVQPTIVLNAIIKF